MRGTGLFYWMRLAMMVVLVTLPLFSEVSTIRASGSSESRVYLPVVIRDIPWLELGPYTRTYIDDFFRYHVVGIVINSKDLSVKNVRVTAYLYDQTGKYLAQGSDTVLLPEIPGGQNGCFNISIAVDDPQKVAIHKVVLGTFSPGENQPLNISKTKIVASLNDVYGSFDVSGSLKNNESVTISNIIEVVTLYDGSSPPRPLHCGADYFTVFELAPGQTLPFVVALEKRFPDDEFTDVRQYDLQIGGVRE